MSRISWAAGAAAFLLIPAMALLLRRLLRIYAADKPPLLQGHAESSWREMGDEEFSV